MDMLKAEGSAAASLIAECAPQGQPMLTQAQNTLEQLEPLVLMETVVRVCRSVMNQVRSIS